MGANITLLEELRHRMSEAGGGHGPAARDAHLATGVEPLDAALPGGGLPAGALTEIFYNSTSPGGAASLACIAARAAARATTFTNGRDFTNGRFVAWIDTDEFYPPAAAALGLDPEKLFMIHPRDPGEALWTFEQTARSRAIAASILLITNTTIAVTRRLQLAAEAGGGLALLLRSAAGAGHPSAASVRLRAQARAAPAATPAAVLPPQRIEIEILKIRGTLSSNNFLIEIDHASGDVRGAAAAADRSDCAHRRAAGA